MKPDFEDQNLDPNKLYYCPECAIIEGILMYYPQLRHHLQIIYINYPRPRKILVDLLGEENQGSPVLVLDNALEENTDISYFQYYGSVKFVNTVDAICRYFSDKFGVAAMHT